MSATRKEYAPDAVGVIDRLTAQVSVLLSYLAAAAILLILVLMVGEVLMRSSGGGSIAGGYELIETAVVLVAFLGFAYAERSRSNVRIELLTSRLRPRLRSVLQSIAGLIALTIAVLLAWASWSQFGESLGNNEVRQGLVQFPLWPARLAVAVGFSALAVEFILSFLRALSAARSLESGARGAQ